MKLIKTVGGLLGAAALTLSSATAADAPSSFSDIDRTFVAKVSQGGMYEVELGKLAQTMATAQDVKDSANTEAHDHQLVGDKLKSIVEANGMAFPQELNPDFHARLERLRATPSDQFDGAYIEDMEKIHKADGAAFAKEADSGKNPDLRAFAAETHRIVQRHLGELGAKVR